MKTGSAARHAGCPRKTSASGSPWHGHEPVVLPRRPPLSGKLALLSRQECFDKSYMQGETGRHAAGRVWTKSAEHDMQMSVSSLCSLPSTVLERNGEGGAQHRMRRRPATGRHTRSIDL